MELAVNRPIRNKIVQDIMTPEVREELKQLKEEKKVDEFRELAQGIKDKIETEYRYSPGVLEFSDAQREAYTTIGGYPDLDGKFNIFGECITGFEVIDKIAALQTDKNNRPFTYVKINVTVLKD
jgi:cyclophilin family peptidyl-prolyl cis-trans isomerase